MFIPHILLGVYLLLKGNAYANNSVIFVSEIGETDGNSITPLKMMHSSVSLTRVHVVGLLLIQLESGIFPMGQWSLNRTLVPQYFTEIEALMMELLI